MDWWARLVGGGAPALKKAPPKNTGAHDPQLRLARFKRVYHTILQLCNKPRNLNNEGPVLDQLHTCIDRIAVLIREETRAPAPHLSLQYASANKIYTTATRAATVSQYEPIIKATVDVFAALVDSEEEDLLSNAPFAKSLMGFVRRVIESNHILITIDTETAILELLFTISAKIRLQPEILSFWFRSTARPDLEDVFVKEKKSFVGITQKDDFPLCYLLIDRVHHDGRIGDFARTGLLYIFEATGRSTALEEWVVSSDLSTLMASGLGALYSQLSRELSILHPDATLPAVLAMSDYSTTHTRPTAESAFSERHQSHMATFLSYLAFWQDVLDHCRSSDVKQTLLDHFQILFLQQLLYPSLLQSSDTDAGSSVAVLHYMTAMLESLEYPDLMNMMLAYLLAVQDDASAVAETPITLSNPPSSPTTVRRRQSLMLLTAPKDPDDAVEPTLFSLVDLILNNINSANSQSVYAALKLSSTLLNRQKKFAIGTLLKVQKSRRNETSRTSGALALESEKLARLAGSLHEHVDLDRAYTGLAEDVRLTIEAQVPFLSPSQKSDQAIEDKANRYALSPDDYFLKSLRLLLRTFFTNSVDVNLALTQAIVSIVVCTELQLEGWLALHPSSYSFEDRTLGPLRQWQSYLDQEEITALRALQKTSQRPVLSDDHTPMLFATIEALAEELDTVRSTVPNLDILISGRKTMLSAANLDGPMVSASAASSPTQTSFLDILRPSRGHSRSSSQCSLAGGRKKATAGSSPHAASLAPPSPAPKRPAELDTSIASPINAIKSIFMPPPPDTPSTTDVLMQMISFPDEKAGKAGEGDQAEGAGEESSGEGEEVRKASLNHVLTNVVVLQEFVLELVAVLQVRAAVLGEKEMRVV